MPKCYLVSLWCAHLIGHTVFYLATLSGTDHKLGILLFFFQSFSPAFLDPKSDKYLICCCLITQWCLTLCDPMVYRLPGSSVHGILQARILEWVVISFSRGSSWPRDRTHISCIGRWVLYQQSPLKKPGTKLRRGIGRSSEEGMAPHTSILAWEIPWAKEHGGLKAMGSHGTRTWLNLLSTEAPMWPRRYKWDALVLKLDLQWIPQRNGGLACGFHPDLAGKLTVGRE